jgi:hypothetical protein
MLQQPCGTVYTCKRKGKKKVKLYHTVKSYVSIELEFYVSITSALVGGEWLASRPCSFTPLEKRPRFPLDRRLGGPHSQSG